MSDPLLEQLVALAEDETPVETAITLLVGGMLVSGRVIAEQTYHAQHAVTRELVAADAGDDVDESEATEDSDEDEDYEEEDEIGFLHLRDARFHAPGQAPSGTGVFCRIALEHVAGVVLTG